ncbi:MAG TPA: hypothetical protein VMU55_09650 [Solirubrobacteraceae bacterium]|nr:hypothetical protein [Solirubrobacteraceae bacterium]
MLTVTPPLAAGAGLVLLGACAGALAAVLVVFELLPHPAATSATIIVAAPTAKVCLTMTSSVSRDIQYVTS